MVSEVNKIIYNTLVAERAVNLPAVGTLSMVRHAATMQSRDVIAPPSWNVVFSSHADATSVVDIIALEGKVDVVDAEDIYSRWLDKVRDGSTINIEGVGVLRDKSFAAEKSLLALFNTSGNTCRIKRNSGGHVLLWVFTLITCTLLGVLSALYKDDIISVVNDYLNRSNEESVESVAYIETTIDEQYDEIVEEIVVGGNISPEEEVLEEVIEESITEDIEAQDMVSEIVNEPIVEARVEDNWTMRDDIRHFVVAGSYSTMANAERAVASLVKQHEDLDCKIFELGRMYAVAIYGSNNHDECAIFMREHRNEFKQTWIFTPKEYR